MIEVQSRKSQDLQEETQNHSHIGGKKQNLTKEAELRTKSIKTGHSSQGYIYNLTPPAQSGCTQVALHQLTDEGTLAQDEADADYLNTS